MLNNNTVSKYVDAITAEAQQAKEDAERKISQYKATQISRCKRAALADSEREIKRRTAIIREDIGREFSTREVSLRQQIFTKREEITSAVFSEASKRLCKFTESPEYKDFVVNSAVEIKKNLIGRDKVIKVYLRECDMELKGDIETAFSFPCEFIADNSILIGGIKAKFSSVIIDDTLDSRLSAQTGWFEENSGLDIK